MKTLLKPKFRANLILPMSIMFWSFVIHQMNAEVYSLLCSLMFLAFCPRTSSKLTQSIIKDHMVSHYKKVYSAKGKLCGCLHHGSCRDIVKSLKHTYFVKQK